ncbi:hypothetical protein F5148DRAFT_1151802 [Russula earlei]|uniref:Uncharacterized protein n=1 Tax=Russula earlei TaxID=71964 RepID=A0ACC0TYR7_9AGAM|nr:hypothetical protein F5148DRAFT_1151802 [Russula earlei]
MPSSFRANTSLVLMEMIIVICVKALPVSSFPIVGLNRNWSSHAVASPSRMTDQKHFDIAITFGEPVDLPASPTQTASAVANFFQSLAPRPVRHLAVAGVPDDRRKARRQDPLAGPRSSHHNPSASTPSFERLTAALRVGINNRGRPATRPTGGPSAPVATALQARLQRTQPGYMYHGKQPHPACLIVPIHPMFSIVWSRPCSGRDKPSKDTSLACVNKAVRLLPNEKEHRTRIRVRRRGWL